MVLLEDISIAAHMHLIAHLIHLTQSSITIRSPIHVIGQIFVGLSWLEGLLALPLFLVSNPTEVRSTLGDN